MKEIGIGILGFGTVGAGVVEGLFKNGELLARRLNVNLVLRKVADLDITSDRGVVVDPALLTTDAVSVVDDPRVDVVIELIGGTGVARELISRALKKGKPVITANKALLAKHGAEIFKLAQEHDTAVYFEAAVGGGIPIIKALREGLCANHIERVYGILNGTCNYILTRMEKDGASFQQVLKEAQKAGYAEAEPSLDVDGYDTAHKAVVLASLAYGFHVPLEDVCVEGIRKVSDVDIGYARESGYRIKLLAVIKAVDGEIEIRVQPTLVPMNRMLASVDGVFNAVLVRGDVVGETMYYGRGAGRAATASAVIGDLADMALNMVCGSKRRLPAFASLDHPGRVRPVELARTRYYVRLTLRDRPGVLAQVATVLGRHDISIASVLQREIPDGSRTASVMIMTHTAGEGCFREAVKEIDALPESTAPAVWLRVEDFE